MAINLIRVLFFTSLFLLGPFFLKAQSLKGKVYTSEGDPLSNAHVILNDGSYATYTNDLGMYDFTSLPEGSYSIKITSIGFEDFKDVLQLTQPEVFDVRLEPKIYSNEVAVVTATRTKQLIEDVSIPVSVITADEVEAAGANTVLDILVEQPGISLSPNESSSIQIQGFESDYTLVLIDGQPVVGRTRGALDLSRVNVNNVQQVELVKGPSSALWGSDAFAGVINIITKKNKDPFSVSAFSEYGSRKTYNTGINLGITQEKLSLQAGGSLNGSNGFDLKDGSFGNNQNPYTNYALNGSAHYTFSEFISSRATYRFSKNEFSGPTLATVQGQEIEIDEDGWQDEQSLVLETNLKPFERFDMTLTGYATRYEDYSTTLFTDPNEPDIITNNKQGFNRIEVQNNYAWMSDQITTFGAGLTSEFVQAERYSGKRTQNGSFLYLQHQYFKGDKFNVTGGARLDNHSTYDSYLSPKLSAQYSPFDRFTIRASVGRGFKAPDFRTLYLNFDNAGSGYRVIGTLNIQEYLEELERDNRIAQYFIDPSKTSSLSPEYSTAYNLGFDIHPSDDLFLKVNAFRNNAKNLIDAVSVAEITDGSELFGYININEAYTQGIESEIRFQASRDLKLNIGYQFLKAVQVQQDTISILENGQIIDKEINIETPLTKRPKHSGSFRISYQEPFYGIEASLRVQLKSQYLYNGSKATNNEEFAPGYSIWNFSASKNLTEQIRIQFGIDNFTNHTDPNYLRYQPGISYFGKLFISFN